MRKHWDKRFPLTIFKINFPSLSTIPLIFQTFECLQIFLNYIEIHTFLALNKTKNIFLKPTIRSGTQLSSNRFQINPQVRQAKAILELKILHGFMSGFVNHFNGAEGIHNFWDLCKYGHVRQPKGGTGASSSTHPTLETNNCMVSIV